MASSREASAALCHEPGCEWASEGTSREEAVVLEVLHLLVKHPNAYREQTGKDPVQAEYAYREKIRAYRRYL